MKVSNRPVYVYGTFTPHFLVNGSEAGITYGVQNGQYTRIGRLVLATVNILLSSKGVRVGNIKITGLPFLTTPSVAVAASLYYSAITIAGGSSIISQIGAGSDELYVNTVAANGVVGLITAAMCSDTTEIMISCAYHTP